MAKAAFLFHKALFPSTSGEMKGTTSPVMVAVPAGIFAFIFALLASLLAKRSMALKRQRQMGIKVSSSEHAYNDQRLPEQRQRKVQHTPVPKPFQQLYNMVSSSRLRREAISSVPHSSGMGEYCGSMDTASTNSHSDAEETRVSQATSSSSGSDLSVTSTSELEEYKKKAVDGLMIEFKTILGDGLYVGLKIRAGGREISPASAMSISSTCPTLENSIGGAADVTADTDNSNSSKVNFKLPPSENTKRFACPFYRRNPKKHLKHRSCGGPGWVSIFRIKEHIYRNHALPTHCNRCGLVVDSDSQLRVHQRQEQGCDVRRIVDFPEGIDKEQEKLLRKKKQGGTEEEKWLEMYRVLFPDEEGDLIPSPYYDEKAQDDETERMNELHRYERFQRRELLRAVRRRLQDAVSDMAGPLEKQLRGKLIEIVRQAQYEVFRSYQANNNASVRSSDIPEQQPPSSDQLFPQFTTSHSDPTPENNTQTAQLTGTMGYDYGHDSGSNICVQDANMVMASLEENSASMAGFHGFYANHNVAPSLHVNATLQHGSSLLLHRESGSLNHHLYFTPDNAMLPSTTESYISPTIRSPHHPEDIVVGYDPSMAIFQRNVHKN
ncbi:hypothetical protein B0H63DRAFT_197093 [Podospora didyma]|uniref:C2H2-type domain-containing protein n=1 Tax=Podospora didyma TaxID=330526 RepID=A0AAE0NGL6_9PEZI|nr:hypothetical protein B0H63DRAFT_197093 [Podospora didyma]